MRRHIDLALVVLHYSNIEDTVETVESMKKNIDTTDFHIAIVDNASPNGSGEALKQKYCKDSDITVILNEQNVGFSAGNNVGINYFLQKYDFEYLILSNNDIYIIDKHLFEKIDSEYKRSNFAVMGPLIMTADGRCDSNPISDVPYTRSECLKEIGLYEKLIKRAENGTFVIWSKYDYYMKKLSYSYSEKHKGPVHKDRRKGIFLEHRENVVLHGCFLIFSKNYFEVFSGLDARTFMYSEENILYAASTQKALRFPANTKAKFLQKVTVCKQFFWNQQTLR